MTYLIKQGQQKNIFLFKDVFFHLVIVIGWDELHHI